MQPTIEPMAIGRLRSYARNARTHSKKQIRQIADSIEKFGFTNPVLISDDDEIIAGHGRVEAARLLGMQSVPALRLSHLDAAQRRAYVLTDNKLAQNAGWDRDVLAIELQALVDIDFDVEVTGFSLAEIDLLLDDGPKTSPRPAGGAEDEIPSPSDPASAVSRPADLWLLDQHRLLCGDPRRSESFDRLLQGERADLVFTDPPYNVAIDGHVCGLGRIRHAAFAMGVGEMSPEAFTAFLRLTLGHAAAACRDGAIAFLGMDWRHMGELIAAGRTVFSALEDLCVWNKPEGGPGSSYGSNHELVFVFRVGLPAPDTKRPGRCASGRCRSNVWDYAGVKPARPGRAGLAEDTAMPATVKPVALVAAALEDCSRPGEIVLDPFGGLGTTLIAAETMSRRARVVEFDPAYCDQIIRRFERLTGKEATLAATGASFAAVADERVPASTSLMPSESVR